jgi:sugar lactone lactonase YvrE
LAAVALLAFVSVSPGQVTVETIGGGVRSLCGSSAGFVAGNTWSTAQFNHPYATALDSQGDLWVADMNNGDIEDVTLAGNKTSSLTFHPLAKNTFPNVVGVAVDSAENLYVLTPTNLVLFANIIESFPSLNYLFSISLSRFSSSPPTAVTVVNDAGTNIYISFTNSSGGTIIRIPQPWSGAYSTVVNNYSFAPAGMSMQANGQLAVSDTLNDGIYAVATNNGSTPVLITGGHGPGFTNGGAAFACFNQPHGIAASADGRLVVCDTMNNYLRVIDTNYVTTTLYGTPTSVWTTTCCTCDPTLYAGWVDGTAGSTTSSASGREPVSVTISTNGTLFVTELYYNLIRSVTGSGLLPVTSINSVSSATNLPVVTTEAASSITGTGATLNASVYPDDSTTTVYFQYWPTTSTVTNYTTNVIFSSPSTLATTNPVAVVLTGLQPETHIFFQAVAYNNGGTSYGSILQFTTAAGPVATTLAASNIVSTTATLNGTVNLEGSATYYYFESGISTNYTNFTMPTLLSTSLGSNQFVTALLTNLTAGSTNHFQLVASNSIGTNFGGDMTFVTLAVPPVFTINPSYGYFPECQTITVTSSVYNVYYTEDGTTPTANSPQVEITSTNAAGDFIGTFQWCNAQVDLSGLRMITVSGGVVNTMQAVTGPTNNQLGFVRGPTNGISSWAFIPIVLDLQSNVFVETLQFLVEVTPIGTAPAITSLTLLPISSNDFVQFIGPSPGNAPVTLSTSPEPNAFSTNGQALLVYTYGTATGLDIQNYGVVGLLEFQIPTNAGVGQTYRLDILHPSGTEVGGQAGIEMTNMPSTNLTVGDLPYLAGDSAPAYGYSAEEFGDGVLENNDVNNAIYASLGVRVPPVNSDIYNAMCVLPQTQGTILNGSKVINNADWNEILLRSVGLSSNWIRYWTNTGVGGTGVLFGTMVTDGSGFPGDPAVTNDTTVAPAAAEEPGSPPGLVWFCQASIGAGTVTNLSPGATCSLPVYANVLPGYSLPSFQFRAIVSPVSNAPSVGEAEFEPAEDIPTPLRLSGLSSNDLPIAWEMGAFTTPLQNSNCIGTLSFQIPPTAQAGQSYAVHFSYVDGSPGDGTDYSMESIPGYAWVLSTALRPASITSDEWKMHFFGSLTSSLAGDEMDADGDGALNWQEYLAGTDPTNPGSVLGFSSAGVATNGASKVALSWLTAPGKTYILESVPNLGGKSWTAINTNTGDGCTYQFIQNNYKGNAEFYRILLQP